MTLIAFAINGDTATILTDSISYSGSGRVIGQASKARHLHHLDTVFASQGDSKFGSLAFSQLEDEGWLAENFDDLLPIAQTVFQIVWEALNLTTDDTEGCVFLIGWSPLAEEFVAYGLDAASGFVPWKIEDTFVFPAPWSYCPSALEITRFGSSGSVPEESLAAWVARPVPSPPQTPKDWLDLGLDAWSTRSLHVKSSRVWIGGGLYLTQLARGAQLTQKIYDFDPDDVNFLAMVTGTLHPRGQTAPCTCESGKAYMDCCLELDTECPCGSDKPVRDCCMLTPEEREERA